MGCSVTGFSRSAECFQGSSMLQRVSVTHSFPLADSPFYRHTLFCSYTQQLMNVRLVSSFLATIHNAARTTDKFLCRPAFLFPLATHRSGAANSSSHVLRNCLLSVHTTSLSRQQHCRSLVVLSMSTGPQQYLGHSHNLKVNYSSPPPQADTSA